MFLLGYDIGSSSVKASLVNAETGKCISSAFFPKSEAEIIAVHPGWAEQHPEEWWKNLKLATQAVLSESKINVNDIKGIGISYQMHGLICVRQRTESASSGDYLVRRTRRTLWTKSIRHIGQDTMSFTPAKLTG